VGTLSAGVRLDSAWREPWLVLEWGCFLFPLLLCGALLCSWDAKVVFGPEDGHAHIGAFQYPNHLEVVTREPSVACSHIKMKNESDCHGQLGVGGRMFPWVFPCMEITCVGEKIWRVLVWGRQGCYLSAPALGIVPGKGQLVASEGCLDSLRIRSLVSCWL
jgi:hypothetical protein